jgi:hypothetical protein
VRVLTVVAVLFVFCGAVQAADRVELRFAKPNRAFRAVCSVGGAAATVAVTRHGRLVRRFSLKTRTNPMDIQAIRLKRPGQPDMQGVFVECSGGSATHIYVFEITPYRAHKLLYGLNKWGFDLGRDSRGRLTGLRFHYWRWHVDTDRCLNGHVYTAIDYKWLPSRGAFRKGGIHADRELEQQASLLDVLRCVISSDPRFAVLESNDEKKQRTTYWYRPTGILRPKTPPALRSKPWVQVVVQNKQWKTDQGWQYSSKIVEIKEPDPVP